MGLGINYVIRANHLVSLITSSTTDLRLVNCCISPGVFIIRNVHWMVLYQICVFGADLKSNMAARVHNVFSLAEI
jgi:hypothetical protein